MKKGIPSLIFAVFTILSLKGQAVIRMVSVDTGNDAIIIENLGDSTLDISGYWLCLGPGEYNALSDYSIVGDLELDQTEGVIVDISSGTGGIPALPDANGGLGLFSTNSFGSSSPDILVDYIQWGAPNQDRVGQAVTAGRWNANTSFVPGVAPYIFLGQATQIGPDFWVDNTTIRFSTIHPEEDTAVVRNFDTIERDISNYWLCTIAGIYPNLGNPDEVEILNGDLNLSPGEELSFRVLTDSGIVDQNGSLFLFSSALLGFNNQSETVTRDFAQWGAGNGFRVENAVAANRWDDPAGFIEGNAPYLYTGAADDLGAEFWESTVVNIREALRQEIALFPNPVSDVFHITNEAGDIHRIRLIDWTGKIVGSFNGVQVNPVRLEVAGLAKGIYVVEILNSQNQLLQLGRIVKQ